MNIWIISSFVLITAVIFFAYAMYVILKQKRLSEVQKDFIDNMAHEFKTPVSTIAIASNVLMEPDISKDRTRLTNYAGIIADQNKRIENQIEKVLQLAKIEKDQSSLSFETVDLHLLIREVIDAFNYTIKESGGKIDFIADANDPYIHADKTHLNNVLYNLIDNALKYTQGVPEINVRTESDENGLILSIQDNGIGMDKKSLHRIFDRFYRVPTGDIHNVKGFGIGLNYVKNIVENHSWKIKVVSEPDHGSTFIIIIPNKNEKR
jgi:two-component system phosphate regulon sensor histidine kinase PhoR